VRRAPPPPAVLLPPPLPLLPGAAAAAPLPRAAPPPPRTPHRALTPRVLRRSSPRLHYLTAFTDRKYEHIY
jgi:hypothetical protein